MRYLRPVLVMSAAWMLSGCQEVEEPKTVLTQQQWKDIQQDILSEAPSPQHKIGANFGDEIELIGFDVHTPLTPGKPIEVTWYWRALKDVSKNWTVFVHLDSTSQPVRQSMDHVPMDGLYASNRWKKGQIIRDRQELTLRPDMPNGPAIPYIGLFDAKSKGGMTRLALKDADPSMNNRVKGPQLTIVGGKVSAKQASATTAQAPRYAVRTIQGDAASITVDGKLDEGIWSTLTPAKLVPFGAGQEYETWVKVFATADALYIAGYMQDEHAWGTLTERDSDTWKQEVLEVFIDPDGDGKDYLELQVTPGGVIFDANFKDALGAGEGTRDEQIDRARAWNMEGLEASVVVDGTYNDEPGKDTSWTVEMKLPFASLPGAGSAPQPGARWATNFYRFDRPGKKQSYAYAWSTGPRGNFHDVSKFGELRFVPTINKVRTLKLPELEGEQPRPKGQSKTQITAPDGSKVDLKPPIPKITPRKP